MGELSLDVAVGAGNVFAIAEARHLGLSVRREMAKRIAQRGMAVRDAVNAQLRVEVPGHGKTSVDNVLVHELPDGAACRRNALVWGPGQVDAAPCGSGTCARMALFHQRGLMAVGDAIESRGLLGLSFTGRIAGLAEAEPGRPRDPARDHRHRLSHRHEPVLLRPRRPPARGISARGLGVKTLVLGGGVVGVTTAYFLAKAGHEVTLLEEKDALGLEATSGNAGIIAPGHSFAWASPRAPKMLWESLKGAETAIRVRLGLDPRLYAWGLRFLRECTAERARANTLVKLRLCQYSQTVHRTSSCAPRTSSTTRSREAPSISTAIPPSSRRGSRRWRCSPSTARSRRS